MSTRWAFLRVAWRQPAVAIALMGVGTLAIAAFGIRGPGQTAPGVLDGLPYLDMWVRWDAGWYRQIAQDGYTYSPTEQSSAAFFPVYPLGIRALMWLTGLSVFIAGVVLTWLAGWVCCITFYLWARDRTDEPTASRAQWLVLAWPFGYYLCGAMYSDALFLVWVTSAFFFLERRNVWAATLFGALATATRPIAPAVVFGLLVRSLELRRREGKPLRVVDFMPLVASVGLFAYMFFLWREFGDPIGFATTQKGWNQLSGLSSVLKIEALSKYKPVDLILPAFHAALAGLCLFLGWRMRRTLGWGYTAYVLAVVGIPLISSRDFIGLGRYSMAGFPIYLELDRLLATKPRARAVWLSFSIAMLVWMTVRFANGRYIA